MSKKCFVEYCTNTSENSNRIFVMVPQDSKRRMEWFQAVRRKFSGTVGTKYYCCEDHFDIESDIENYVQYKLMKGDVKMRLRPHVIPHKFTWPSASYKQISTSTQTNIDHKADSKSTQTDQENVSVSRAIQSERKSIRSVGIYCSLFLSNCKNKETQTESRKRKTPDSRKFSSPMSSPEKRRKVQDKDFTSSDLQMSPSTSSSSSGFKNGTPSQNTLKNLIKKFPKRYIGIPKPWFDIIVPKLCQMGKLKEEDVYLTLMKIKLNDSFARLADQFSCSVPQATKIFKKTLTVLAHYFRCFVFWPDSTLIKKNLPIAFRFRYNNVQSIIDCLEVQIEKPTNPIKQAMTWSEYKKCNTVKYLISCTPDGLINYISTGFGGRTSDCAIVEASDYLSKLPEKSVVMADRGFKGIPKLLEKKHCELVKPASVSTSEKPTKQQVIESKRIASLRIHVERVIRRLREFTFLKPHAVINHNLIGETDYVVKVVCGLINLQSPLIRKQ